MLARDFNVEGLAGKMLDAPKHGARRRRGDRRDVGRNLARLLGGEDIARLRVRRRDVGVPSRVFGGRITRRRPAPREHRRRIVKQCRAAFTTVGDANRAGRAALFGAVAYRYVGDVARRVTSAIEPEIGGARVTGSVELETCGAERDRTVAYEGGGDAHVALRIAEIERRRRFAARGDSQARRIGARAVERDQGVAACAGSVRATGDLAPDAIARLAGRDRTRADIGGRRAGERPRREWHRRSVP